MRIAHIVAVGAGLSACGGDKATDSGGELHTTEECTSTATTLESDPGDQTLTGTGNQYAEASLDDISVTCDGTDFVFDVLTNGWAASVEVHFVTESSTEGFRLSSIEFDLDGNWDHQAGTASAAHSCDVDLECATMVVLVESGAQNGAGTVTDCGVWGPLAESIHSGDLVPEGVDAEATADCTLL